MRVVYYHRKPASNAYSIEEYFQGVRERMPPEVECSVATSRFISQGAWRRAYNIVEAPFRQGDINHITGDVHFLAYLLLKRKTVLTILDSVSLHTTVGIKHQLLLKVWYEWPVRRSVAITAISEFTKRDVLRFVNCDPAMIRVIPVFVSPQFMPKPRPFNVAEPRILHIGTAPNKNLERLAQSLEGVRCHLDIVGRLSAGQVAALERSGVRYSNAVGLSKEDMIRKYDECDLLAFASTYEGFGMPIVEANAVGRPVIAGNAASMPEVANDAACLVDPLDPAAMRAGILRVIRDEGYRRQLIDNGFRNRDRFDPMTITRAYLDLYREVLAQ